MWEKRVLRGEEASDRGAERRMMKLKAAAREE